MEMVEIDFVVSDSLAALELYKSIFDLEIVEATAFPKGQNEVVFNLYGVRFHMLDEHPAYQLIAPKPGDPRPVWFNLTVPDIRETFGKALAAGSMEVQPVTEMPEMGIANAMFADTFGYLWMLHQVYREVGFGERVRIMEENMNNNQMT